MATEFMIALCETESTDVIGYMNVYEEGDIWMKIRGCESCPLETRKRCCNNCPMFTEKGCFFHLDNMLNKPFRCVVLPLPTDTLSWCQLAFRCVKGTKKDLIREVKVPSNEFKETLD